MIRRSLTAAIAAIAITSAPMAVADEGGLGAQLGLPERSPQALDDFIHSPKGRTFRVRFDPESRIRLGAAASGARKENGRITPALEVHAGISVRRRYAFGEGPSRIEWQFDQRILSGFVAPFARPFGDMPSFDAVLYGAAAHRHDLAPRIVLPSSPPLSIPFPFDVGFDAEFGRVTVPRALPTGAADGGAIPFLRVSVARATAYLDPLRSNHPGRSLEIGVGVRYDLDVYGAQRGTGPADSIARPRLVHRVAPGTAGSIRFRFETQDGLLSLDTRAEITPHWTSERTWKLAALGYGRVERTILAINDEPISVFLEGSYRLVPPTLELATLHDVRASLGISFGLDLTPDPRVKKIQPRSRQIPTTAPAP
ncbi:hypothetical protein [Polyangium sorediatum]|uniref:Uncharacterized protein n=1 Tax=Polyangium sorediatum TaxID=889274 RepID=A0ABT6P725_9BACT|nr:hypothetical protein [Polyangium sorediatum]MDI1436423.1 hypothetical protein [Polyangium sorediatum]